MSDIITIHTNYTKNLFLENKYKSQNNSEIHTWRNKLAFLETKHFNCVSAATRTTYIEWDISK